jgi:hypothetical protein
MTDASALYQAVLLIKAEEPDAAVKAFPATEQRPGLDETLAFVQGLLRTSGMCRESHIVGAELVALFNSAAAALEAACSVQQACAGHGHPPESAYLRILLDRQPDPRAGDSLHTPAVRRSDHAEQLLQRLPAGQIFATRAITGHLSEVSRARFRFSADDSELYQVVCHEETITRIAVPTLNQDRMTVAHNLCLRWRDAALTLTPESPSLTIGRSDQCDIPIDSELASRIHARLGFHETNFILADQSTNGTFVQIEDDEEVCLHHERIVLRGSGVISLGRRILGGRGKLIYFTLTN